MKQKIAQIVSLIFGPLILWPITLFFILTKSGIDKNRFSLLASVVVLLQIVIPFGTIIVLLLKKKVHDFDLTERKERYLPLFIMLICLIVSMIFILNLGNKFIIDIYKTFLILMIINYVITLFWKISFHMTTNVIFVLIMNLISGWKLPGFFIVIPIIFWSRLALEKHDVYQLIGAFLINCGLILGCFKYFGYI